MMRNRINDLPLFDGSRIDELKLVGTDPVDTESLGSDVFCAALAGKIDVLPPIDGTVSKKTVIVPLPDAWWDGCKWDD